METNVKTLNNKRFGILVKNVKIDTSYNLHSEALVEIAEFFGYEEYISKFKEYSEKETLTVEDFNVRCEVKDRMFFIIQAEYGNDVVERLDKVM